MYVFGGLLLHGVWDSFVDSRYDSFMFSAIKFAIKKKKCELQNASYKKASYKKASYKKS